MNRSTQHMNRRAVAALLACGIATGSFAANAADAPKVQTLAAGELREGPLVRVKSLGISGASASDVDVVVVETLPEGVDGFLGLNALMQFQVNRTAKGFELSPLP